VTSFDTGSDAPDGEADLLAQTLNVLGERWSFLILRDLWVRGPRRFGQLLRNLQISRNILARRLGTLLDAGVIGRRPYQQHPPRYDYFLTDAGGELVPTLLFLLGWGDRYLAGAAGPPMLFQHRGHEHLADPMTVCRLCGEELTVGVLEPSRPADLSPND